MSAEELDALRTKLVAMLRGNPSEVALRAMAKDSLAVLDVVLSRPSHEDEILALVEKVTTVEKNLARLERFAAQTMRCSACDRSFTTIEWVENGAFCPDCGERPVVVAVATPPEPKPYEKLAWEKDWCPTCKRGWENPPVLTADGWRSVREAFSEKDVERVIGMLLTTLDDAILACLKGQRPSVTGLVEGAIAAGELYGVRGSEFVEKWKRILAEVRP